MIPQFPWLVSITKPSLSPPPNHCSQFGNHRSDLVGICQGYMAAVLLRFLLSGILLYFNNLGPNFCSCAAECILCCGACVAFWSWGAIMEASMRHGNICSLASVMHCESINAGNLDRTGPPYAPTSKLKWEGEPFNNHWAVLPSKVGKPMNLWEKPLYYLTGCRVRVLVSYAVWISGFDSRRNLNMTVIFCSVKKTCASVLIDRHSR